MLVLKRRTTAQIPLTAGVTLTVIPAGQADFDLAQAMAARHIVMAEEGENALARYGVAGAAAVPEKAADLSLRLGIGAVSIELGLRHVTAWTGIGAELAEIDEATGKPKVEAAAVDLVNIATLFNGRNEAGKSFGEVFFDEMQKLSILKSDAGNGSAA